MMGHMSCEICTNHRFSHNVDFDRESAKRYAAAGSHNEASDETHDSSHEVLMSSSTGSVQAWYERSRFEFIPIIDTSVE